MAVSQDLPKLTVRTVKDLVEPAKPETLHAKPVEVTAIPEVYPVISGWELILSSFNCAMRQYVTQSVTGRIIGSKLQFWMGVVSTVVVEAVIVFLLWKLGVF